MSSTSSSSASLITVQAHHVPSADPALPGLVVQVTRLQDSYMLWVGLADTLSGEDPTLAPARGALSRDWACAMPSMNPNIPAPGTTLLGGSSADHALPMAQRLARRFKKQIFLAVDVPPSFVNADQAPRLLLEVERALVGRLKISEDDG